MSEIVLPRPLPGTPLAPRVPHPERTTLGNGLRVLAVEHRTLPQVALRLVLPAGAAADPEGRPGTAALVGALLTEGTESLSAEALNERLDALGASVSVHVGHDFAEIDLFLLTETLAEGVELLADLVTRPAFPEPEVERVRAETLDALDARQDEPGNVADDRLGLELFGAEHPYGRPAIGTPEGVAAVREEDLRAFHGAYYRPDGAVLLIAGDVTAGEAVQLLERAFGGWTGAPAPLVYPPPPPLPAPRRVYLGRAEAAQGEIRVAGLGMPRNGPDWVPAAVANYLLGGSTITGRLGANLREEKGWTYGVRSGFAAGLQPAGWVVDTAVDAEVIAAAEREIRHETDRFLQAPVAEEELQRAKDALVLSLPRAFETPGRIIGRLATVEAYGLPHDYWDRFPEQVAAVTPDEALRLARRYFDPANLLHVVVGPPAEGEEETR